MFRSRVSCGSGTRIAAAKGGVLKRSVTIIDIAERAGVSFKTVSRVLNGAPTVAEELRGKVEAAMRELDYKPNRAARLLRGGQAQALGFIVGVHAEARDSRDLDRRMPCYGDRKSVWLGKSVATSYNRGGRHHMQKIYNNTQQNQEINNTK